VADAADVDPAGGNVGRDQHAHLARLELAECTLALRLALIAVDRVGGDAVASEQPNDTVCTMLGAGEDERTIDVAAAKHQGEKRLLLRLLDEGDRLLDTFSGRCHRVHRDLRRIGEEAIGEILDRLRHGGRKEEGLPLFGQKLHDRLQSMDEAEVEHLVGLVEDEDLDRAKRQEALLDEVDQATGRGHENVDAACDILTVLVDRGAAENGRDGQRREAGISPRILRDLRGKLARRRKDEHPAGARLRPLVRGNQTIDRRQREGRRLAGAGLRNAEEVATLEDDRNGLGLDRS